MRRARWMWALLAAGVVGCCEGQGEGTCTPERASPDSAPVCPDCACADSARPDSARPDSAVDAAPDGAVPDGGEERIGAWERLVLGRGPWQHGDEGEPEITWMERLLESVRFVVYADGRYVVAEGYRLHYRPIEVIYREGVLTPAQLALIDEAVRQTTWRTTFTEGEEIHEGRQRVSIWQGERVSIFQEPFGREVLTDQERALLDALKTVTDHLNPERLYTPEGIWVEVLSFEMLTHVFDPYCEEDCSWGYGIPQAEIDALTAVAWPYDTLPLESGMVFMGSRLPAALAFCEAGRALGHPGGLFFIAEQGGVRYPAACQAVPPGVRPTPANYY